MCLLGVAVFLAALLGVLLLFSLAPQRDFSLETVYQIFYFLFLFLLAGAVPFVASTLLQSGDYALLFVSPIPPRSVIAAKLLEAAAANSVQFTVLGIPAILACAYESRISALGWILLPAIIVLFALLPALLTALALLVALSVVGMRRLRAAVTIMNAAMATVVCITIVLEAGHLPLKAQTFNPMSIPIRSSAQTASPGAHMAPSAQYARLLVLLGSAPEARADAPAGAHPGMRLRPAVSSAPADEAPEQGRTTHALTLLAWLALVDLMLFGLCVEIGSRLISASSVAEEDRTTAPGSGLRREGRLLRRLLPSTVAALIIKDFKYMGRDTVLMSQLAMPLILFLVPFILALQDTSMQFREEMFPFASAMTGMILFMQTSILSLSSIGLESRSFWLMIVAPTTSRSLLWAKFLMSTMVAVAIGLALTLMSGLAFGVGLRVMAIQAAFVLFSSAALCGMGVGISASFPRFIYENPAHRVSAWALILGFAGSVCYVTAAATVYAVAYYLQLRALASGGWPAIWLVATAMYLVMTIAAIAVPMTIGARRIELYQWEH
jgi:hypothetical protein